MTLYLVIQPQPEVWVFSMTQQETGI